jgi:hypothetical protein
VPEWVPGDPEKIMRPKGKLFALVALFAAVGLITATGAFTTVEAERTATVQVTGDANALLGLQESDDISAGSVTTIVFPRPTYLDDDALGDAQGLNPDANTTITPLVTVTNNGENTVDLNVTVDLGDDSGLDNVTVVDADGNELGIQELESGDATDFGLRIDTGTELDSFDITVTFEANEA